MVHIFSFYYVNCTLKQIIYLKNIYIYEKKESNRNLFNYLSVEVYDDNAKEKIKKYVNKL